ncbi:ATP-binding protein (plasmid) [Synechococcus elongatus IITB7]|uniref:Fic family protein n=1 Tax=Synechococcus elongatus TaxID=32046 RepID=UPI0030CD72CD
MSAESQRLDWKESWKDDYLKWICAFANTEGGTLVIGRNDQGKIVGIPNARKLLEDLPNKIRDTLGVMVEVNLCRQEGKDFLELVTPAYRTPINYKGSYYRRIGSTTQEMKGSALNHFLLDRCGRTWDGAPLVNVQPEDLSPAAFSQFRSLARLSGRLAENALAEPDAALLQRLRLTEGDYLKRAAVLLFHPDPRRYIGGAFVKIAFFQTTDELLYQDEIEGDLFTQVRQTLDLLLTKYLKAAITYQDIVRVETFPVPREALREALLNAIVHRDYMVPAPIQIRVYNDRLEIRNPAVLPEGWTIETLQHPPASQPHNPVLADTFFRAGEIESWGRGIDRIWSVCQQQGNPAPDLEFDGGWLQITFPFSAAYLDWLQGQAGTTTGRVVTVKSGTRITTEVTTQVTTAVSMEVRLLQALQQPRKRRELQAALQLNNAEHFRKTYLIPALTQGLIEMTIPDKPNSRLQQYRLTATGRDRLKALTASKDV